MGYYSTIEDYQLEFQTPEKEKEFKELGNRIKAEIEPLYKNFDVKNGEIEIGECYLTIYEKEKWAPILAKYVKGEMTVYGDMPGDIWKIVWDGRGNYKYYQGHIEFIEEKVEA